MTYRVSVELHANKEFITEGRAIAYANEWLERLGGLDKPGTWDDCNWKITEGE